MSNLHDPTPSSGPFGEWQLGILKQAFRCCLIGSFLCLALIGMSAFFPRRIGIPITGFSLLAAFALLFLSALLSFWHASASLAIDADTVRRTGAAISKQADEMARQWAWATALCRLPRWPILSSRRGEY